MRRAPGITTLPLVRVRGADVVPAFAISLRVSLALAADVWISIGDCLDNASARRETAGPEALRAGHHGRL